MVSFVSATSMMDMFRDEVELNDRSRLTRRRDSGDCDKDLFGITLVALQ